MAFGYSNGVTETTSPIHCNILGSYLLLTLAVLAWILDYNIFLDFAAKRCCTSYALKMEILLQSL